MSKRFIAVLVLTITLVVCANAQSAPPTTQTPAASTPAAGAAPQGGQKFMLAASLMRGYQNIERNLTEAAEKMPEADYGFKPTPTMRPFSQLVAHIALSQFGSCSRYKGQPNPNQDKKEQDVTTKADAVALLKASTALCNDAFSNLTDANVGELIKVGANESARGNFVAGANAHGNELYGTMAVYLRLKGLTPPTTEREEAQRKAAAAPAEQPKPATTSK